MSEDQLKAKLALLNAYRMAFWPDLERTGTHALWTLAESYADVSQWDDAEGYARRLILHTPENAEAHWLLAHVLEHAGHVEKAFHEYCEALQLGDTGYSGDAIADLAEAMEPSQAVTLLGSAASKYPGLSIFKEQLANALQRKGDLDKSEGLYRELLSDNNLTDERILRVELDLASVIWAKGRHEEAVALRANALRKRAPQSRLRDEEDTLAEQYLAIGAVDKAVEIYAGWVLSDLEAKKFSLKERDGYALAQNFDLSRSRLSEIRRLIGEEKLTAGGRLRFKEFEVSHNTFGKLMFALSRCLKHLGQDGEAQSAFEQARVYFEKDKGQGSAQESKSSCA